MGKKVFEVEISNTGPKGYETATILGLPATRAEFQDALQKARIKDSRCCRNELVSIHFAGISSGQIGRDVDLLELNFLAERLTLLDADGRKGLEGLIQMEQDRLGAQIPLSRFINLTFHTDLCRFISGVSSEKELGTFLYENKMLPQAAMSLLDTAEPAAVTKPRYWKRLAKNTAKTKTAYSPIGDTRSWPASFKRSTKREK